MSNFQVFIDGVTATARYHPQSSSSSLSTNFCSGHRYRSRNGKVQLAIGISVQIDTSVDSFFCNLDCSISGSSDLSCDISLGRDWINYVSTTFPIAKISLSETEHLDFGVSPRVGVCIEEGVFFLAALIFDVR